MSKDKEIPVNILRLYQCKQEISPYFIRESDKPMYEEFLAFDAAGTRKVRDLVWNIIGKATGWGGKALDVYNEIEKLLLSEAKYVEDSNIIDAVLGNPSSSNEFPETTEMLAEENTSKLEEAAGIIKELLEELSYNNAYTWNELTYEQQLVMQKRRQRIQEFLAKV